MPKSTKDLSYSEQHVRERALERYGLELDASDYRKLNEAVQHARDRDVASNSSERVETADEAEIPLRLGAATLLNHEGDEQIWGVAWAAQTLVCVWNTPLGRVTTLLPEGTVVTRRKGTNVRKGKK